MIYRITLEKLAAIGMSLALGVALSAAQAPAAAPTQSDWERPAAELAGKIADAMGPGQARLTVRNNSTIAADEIPEIRKLLVQDLKARGVTESGAESANAIRVTLSENVRERLWVAEIIQGSETRVAMVRVEARASSIAAHAKSGLALRKEMVVETTGPMLAATEYNGWAAAAFPDNLILYGTGGGLWKEARRVELTSKWFLDRDSHAVLFTAPHGDVAGFEGHVGRLFCQGAFGINDPDGHWVAGCGTSDDPWPIAQIPAGAGGVDGAAQSVTQLKAFYNAARNYFTGVVTPSVGVDLPAFYSAGLVPRPGGAGLLIAGIDGKVQMAENGALKTVSGTRDWGSDFAVLHSGCSLGDQVIASGSSEAVSDSLRAYEVPALEAIPASALLAMEGTVTALWSAPDGKSVMATVRHADGGYEVDRVTALCN